jgi:hypothetical protein
MPNYCARDDGWPKKRCRVRYNEETGEFECRHWSKGITDKGCGPGMWKTKAKDGSSLEVYASFGKNNINGAGKE